MGRPNVLHYFDISSAAFEKLWKLSVDYDRISKNDFFECQRRIRSYGAERQGNQGFI